MIVLCLSLTMITTGFGQMGNENSNESSRQKPNHKSCQTKQNLKITSAALDLIESYRKLLNPAALCKGSSNILTSFGKMQAAYFANLGATPSVITFSSFFEGVDAMRTIWADKPAAYDYYGVCPPPTIIFPIPPASGNHVYSAKFVTVANYTTEAKHREHSSATGVVTANIQSIDCIKLEEDYGFVAASDNVAFKNILYSKGILALLSMKDGTQIWCYVLNNYDTAGTLKWKE